MCIGNIEFQVIRNKTGMDEPFVANESMDLLNQVASLLQLTGDEVQRAMTTKV